MFDFQFVFFESIEFVCLVFIYVIVSVICVYLCLGRLYNFFEIKKLNGRMMKELFKIESSKHDTKNFNLIDLLSFEILIDRRQIVI
jgi:hypothetical protein